MNGFMYSWYIADEQVDDSDTSKLIVRGYGVNTNGDNICLHIHGFYPYFFVEVDMDGVDWTESLSSYVSSKIKERVTTPMHKPFSICRKQKLYYFQQQTKFPFLRIRFPSIEARKTAFYRLNKYKTRIMGKSARFIVHEYEASPLLQLVCEQNIPTCGWMSFEGKERPEKVTQCVAEYNVNAMQLHPIVDDHKYEVMKPVTLSFDLEVYSSNPKRMPSAEIDSDCIFQISCVVEDRKGHISNYLINLGQCDKLSNVRCIQVSTEAELLMEFHRLVRMINPNIIIGYNIFGFDLPYLIARAKKCNVFHIFDVLGMHLRHHSKEKTIRWSSSAYANQEFFFLDTEGRIFVDLLPIIRRDYKFANYKLKTVSTFFLGETKDPLTHLDIFKAYAEGCKQTTNGRRLMSRCGKYCVQDSNLVLKLFNTLQLWIGLVEMAKICNVPLLYLFTQGQQIKVYSQVYKKGCQEGILIQSPPLEDEILQNDTGYTGAYVFPPSPGVYEWVVPFDFSSLYPTTIIAYNIDYSTLVVDESIPDSDCHVIEWEDHVGCEHDTSVHTTKPAKQLCKNYRFRFIKSPQGVIPSLLNHLLKMRSETKKQMKGCPKESTLCISLDKRQLAYKVSANSMYGAMGVKKGYMPFIPGAMCTTAMGRLSIQKAATFVQQKHKGELVYGDSVAGYTPLLIKKNDSLSVMSIENLYKEGRHHAYPQFKPWIDQAKTQSIHSNNLYIMSSDGWTKIRRVIRHCTEKKMYRVITNKGCVDVTEDHSLLRDNMELIRPGDLNKGQSLLHANDIPGLNDMDVDHKSMLTRVKLNHHQSFYISNQHQCSGLTMMLSTFSQCDYQIVSDNHGYMLSPIDYSAEAIVQDIILLGDGTVDVYDIETECGNFMAGLGTLIVKNTDSIYCHFKNGSTAPEVWQQAKMIEKQFLSLFPPPMKLVFEEKLYKVFLILTKKRYMAYTCDEKGVMDEQLTIRGVLLARRDNCRWIREVYENIVRMIMENKSWSMVEDRLLDMCKQLFYRNINLSKFVITKAVGKDYKIRPLPTDLKKCQKRLMDLDITPPKMKVDIDKMNNLLAPDCKESKRPDWISEYILRSKPAHVQLAEKMARRGHPVEVGSRLEYVIAEHPNPKAKQFEKIEDPAYCKKHGDLVKIDPYYYLQALAKPLDQLFQTVYHKKNYVYELFKLHYQFHKVQEEIYGRNVILRFQE